MIGKYAQGKTGVFIDAANLELSLKSLGWYVAYKRLYTYFQTETDLQFIRHYCPRFDDPGQDRFFTLLKRTGYKVVTKPLKTIADHQAEAGYVRKANFDVEIALDAWILQDRYETLVLFSGDSDFDSLLQRLRQRRKRLIVVSARHHISKELIRAAHRFIDLKHLRPRIERSQ